MSESSIGAEHLREVLRVVPDLVMVVSPDQKILFFNQPAEGYEVEDVVGRDARSFVDPEHRQAQDVRVEKALQTGESVSYEIPIRDADGVLQWYEGILTRLDQDGEIVGVVSVMRNVTARREAQERAKRLESLVPVCSWCHKIRDDQGYWQELESYIADTSGSHVTHGMCPECEERVVRKAEERA